MLGSASAMSFERRVLGIRHGQLGVETTPLLIECERLSQTKAGSDLVCRSGN